VRTRWDTSDLWIRRGFRLAEPLPERAALRIHHDENASVYLNGQPVATLDGFTTAYETVEIPASALREGDNTLAIHCHQTGGGQFIDCGLDALLATREP
jgi:hypothetical protein